MWTAYAKNLSLAKSREILYHKKLQGQPLAPYIRYPWTRKLPNLCDIISSLQKDFFCFVLVPVNWRGTTAGGLGSSITWSLGHCTAPPRRRAKPSVLSNKIHTLTHICMNLVFLPLRNTFGVPIEFPRPEAILLPISMVGGLRKTLLDILRLPRFMNEYSRPRPTKH